jgi:5-methylcytosine-specific restriction endonuclease McrA
VIKYRYLKLKIVQECTLCKESLKFDDLYKNIKKKSGYSNVCKKCTLTAVKKHNQSPDGKAKDTVRRALLKQKRVEAGLCVKCNRVKLPYAVQGDFHCVQDASKGGWGRCDNKTVNLLLKRFRDNPRCPYTGEDLQLGFNAHLDHINPRHRFPSLISSIDNVEWILEKANLAKSGMTREEFIAFCQQVVNLCGGVTRGV